MRQWQNQPQAQIHEIKIRHEIRKTEHIVIVITSNILSFFRTKACENLINVLKEYGIHIAALLEIR